MRILGLIQLLAAMMLCAVPRDCAAGEPSQPPATGDEQLTRGMTEFALALYGEMAMDGGNTVVSPLSVSIATAMLEAGAAGETRAEIAAATRIGLPEEELHTDLRELLRELTARVNHWAELSFANGVWVDRRCKPSGDYGRLMAECYGAVPGTLRFGKDPEGASAQINGFVSGHTRGRIPSVVSPEMFTDDTRLVLADVVYFLGAWEHRFRRESTKEEPFHPDGRSAVPVPLMYRTMHTRLYQDEAVQVLEMPFQGSGLSMLVVLPASSLKLADIEARLSPALLSTWVQGLARQDVDVAIPRFEVSRRIDLIPLLSRMGMRRSFTELSAELPGLCSDPNVFVDLARHQAVLGISEEGTEAAAATVYKATLGLDGMPRGPLPFRADRPFMFILQDMERGTILFIGRFVDPKI